jgi:putative heme-binding domain-containing protein
MRKLIGILVPVLALAQHGKDDEKARHPFMGDPARIEAGRRIYVGGCAGCHGPEGMGGRGPSLVERGAWHPMSDEMLYKTIQNGVGIMPAAKLPEDRGWELAAFVRSLTAPAIEMKAPGDAAAGAKLFWGSAGCAACHRIGDKGGMAGPNLSNAGRSSTLPKLRRSILDPDYERTPGFERAEVVLRDGGKLSGLVKDRTNYQLQLQLNDGALRTLDMKQVETVELQPGSAMPRDYGSRLSRQDITNLVSFLREQSPE